jgi:hypothetical protein
MKIPHFGEGVDNIFGGMQGWRSGGPCSSIRRALELGKLQNPTLKFQGRIKEQPSKSQSAGMFLGI